MLQKTLDNMKGFGDDVMVVGEDEHDGPPLQQTDTSLPSGVDSAINEAIKSSIDGDQDNTNTVKYRVARCKERQNALVNRSNSLLQRINSLRAQVIGQHAANQIQTGVANCDKRLGRLGPVVVGPKGDHPTETTNPTIPGATSKLKLKDGGDGETKIRRAKVRKISKSKADETFGQLRASLRQIQHSLDPEATESSSGGESCDEQEKFQAGATLYAPIKERAEYRWRKKRSELAAQWGWTQCQIADLEFRIRQNSELYRVYREAKGAVVLAEPSVPAAKAGQYMGSAFGPDGVKRRPVEFDYSSEDTEAREEDKEGTCARVRPVNRVKRRKYIDTYGLHHSNAKANKPSSISCSCLHPEQWCVLCLGRRNHTQKLDPFNQSRDECVSLLDHSYHIVLSSRNELPLSLALAEGVKKRKWSNLPTSAKNTLIPAHLSKLMDINDREKLEEERRARLAEKRAAAMRRKEEAKLQRPKKSRADSLKQADKSRPNTPEMKTTNIFKEIKEIRDAKELHKIRDSSTLQEEVLKRKRKNSYDIDHVVIPFNLNTPRVEKPKYKEIQTPSWREVDKPYPWPPPGSSKKSLSRKPEPPKPLATEPDFEDISDLTMAILHAKAEEEERIRWATPLGRVHGGQRQRANRARRLDSYMTEASSGACTPDPLSPGLLENIVVQTRPSSPQDEGAPLPQAEPSPNPTGGGTGTGGTGSSAVAATAATGAALPSPGILTTAATSSTSSAAAATGQDAAGGSGTTGTSEKSAATVSFSSVVDQIPAASSSGFSSVTPVPASVKNRRRTSSVTKSRDRNLSEASQHSQESSRSTSPWTDLVEVMPYEKRQFPLTDEEMVELEDEEDCKMRPPPPPDKTPVDSAATSRTTSRSSSLVEDNSDPDWDEENNDEEEEEEEEEKEEDPEYKPSSED